MPNFGTRRRQLLKTLALNRLAIYSWRRKPHTSSSSELLLYLLRSRSNGEMNASSSVRAPRFTIRGDWAIATEVWKLVLAAIAMTAR